MSYRPFQKNCDSEEARLFEKAGLLGSTHIAKLLERAIARLQPLPATQPIAEQDGVVPAYILYGMLLA